MSSDYLLKGIRLKSKLSIPRSVYFLTLLGVIASTYTGLILMMIALPQFQGLIFPLQTIGWMKCLQRLSDNAFLTRFFIFGGYPLFTAAVWWVLFDFFKDVCKTDTSSPYMETIPRNRKLLAGFSILPPLAWFLASDRWLLGKRAGRSTLNYFWCATFAVIIGLFVYAGHRIYDKESLKLMWFAQNVISYPEEFSASYYLFFIGSMALLASTFIFCVSTLMYSLAPCQLVLKDRLRRGVPFIIGLAILASMLLGLKMIFNAYGMHGQNFTEALNLPDRQPQIKSVLLLSSDGKGIPKATLRSLPITAQLIDFSLIEDVPTTPSNLAVVESYIAKNKRAFYLKDAYVIEALGHYANWDVSGGTHWLHEAGMRGGSLISRMMALAVLGIGPTTPENKAYLDKWADESIWWHGVSSAAKIARIYALYGDATKAKYFQDKAIELQNSNERDPRLTIEGIRHDFTPRIGTLTDGHITGHLILEEGQVSPERVGLFRVGLPGVPGDKPPFHDPDMGGPAKFATYIYLLDAREIGKDLKFSFTNVRDGIYELAFMFNADKLPANSKIIVKNNPGCIQIDRQRRVKDLSAINISRS